MDKLTIKKIVEINCNKRIASNSVRKTLISNYNNFVDSVDSDLSLKITRSLSISDTVTISIKSKKFNKVLAAYLWCFEDLFYLKTPTETFICNDLSEILLKLNYYFYN